MKYLFITLLVIVYGTIFAQCKHPIGTYCEDCSEFIFKPENNIVTVLFNKKDSMEIAVYDTNNSKYMLQRKIIGKDSIHIDVSKYEPSLYFFRVTRNKNVIIRKKIFKQ